MPTIGELEASAETPIEPEGSQASATEASEAPTLGDIEREVDEADTVEEKRAAIRSFLDEAVDPFDRPQDLFRLAATTSSDALKNVLSKGAERLSQMESSHGVARPGRLGSNRSENNRSGSNGSGSNGSEDLSGLFAESRPGHAGLRAGRQPRPEKGAIQVDTLRLKGIGSGTGSGDYVAREVEEASAPRYCVGGLFEEKTGRNLRAIRVEIVNPAGIPEDYEPSSEETRSRLDCIPQPEGEKDLREIEDVFDGNAQDWQQHITYQRLKAYAEETGRLPVFSTPESQCRGPFTSYTVTLMDEDLVHEFAAGGVSELHYLQSLMSGGGFRPGTTDPDYREQPYVALTPQEASRVAELLGAGPYVEGEGEDETILVDGRSMTLLPEWPETNFEALEYQIRAVTGFDDEDARLTVTKGMTRPYRPSIIEDAVLWYEQDATGPQKERYADAYQILSAALDREEPTVVLVKDDMVKVGHEEMDRTGRALICGTYIRGSFDQSVDEFGRRRPELPYKIIGGSQLTQFLRPERFSALRDHLHAEAQTVAEKLSRIDGIAELAGEATAQKHEEITGDSPDGSSGSCYQTGGDLLSDAILGGGVRVSGKSLQEEMTGEASGHAVQMLSSVRGRLDSAVASHIRRRLFNGFGIYGYGTHHAAVANSQTLLCSYWRTEIEDHYLAECRHPERTDLLPTSPVADPSATAIPHKVTALMNADDDGDIVTGLAANMEVRTGEDTSSEGSPKRMKVILIWRYPCVDVPVLWALPEGTPTPFDAWSEEEEERFSRILEIFQPEVRSGQPAIEEDDITLLRAAGARRLSEQGAKEQVSKTKRRGALTTESAFGLVQKKRKLNRAGPLTRDLERLGDLMALADVEAGRSAREGKENFSKHCSAQTETYLQKAGDTSVACEENLTAFKYETDPDLSSPELKCELFPGRTATDEMVRQEFLPLDYHQEIEDVTSVIQPHFRPETGVDGNELEDMIEDWDGPRGKSRGAQLIRSLVRGEDAPLMGVVDEMYHIETDPAPFVQAMKQRLTRWAKDLKSEGRSIPESHRKEQAFVESLCRYFREFWREIMEISSQLMEEAEDAEAMSDLLDEWHSEASRQMQLTMQALGQEVSWHGLAAGLINDWARDEENLQEQPGNSTAAGVALLQGRMGEVFLPYEAEIDRVEQAESFCVVYRSGQDIPIDYLGATTPVADVRIDRDAEVIYAKLEGGDVVDLKVDSAHSLPPEEIEGTTPYDVSLSRTAPRSGLLRWKA